MPELVWYRSLYFRIALGFVGLLATLLLVQGGVFLWMTGRMQELLSSQSPETFAAAIARDVESVLSERPETNLETYLNQRYARAYRSFVVVTLDGTTVVGKAMIGPPIMTRAARERLFGGPDRRGGPGGGRPGRPPGIGPPPELGPLPPDVGPPPDHGPPLLEGDARRDGGRGRGFGGPGGPRGPALTFASAIVDGQIRAIVATPTELPPFNVAITSIGPTLAVVALILLGTGTAIAAVVVFGPARHRLLALQGAARALGEGRHGVRAPENGRDEVAVLAHAFNEMAGQLEDRTSALENADRTRRQLLADVSHELTTPLASIRGYVETLAMTDLQLSEATRSRYLAIVTEEAERLEHIIGDLLDLARLEGGGGSVRVEQVSMAYLLERIWHRHGPVVAARGIALETTRDPAVDIILGDSNRLEQALQNLVANAVRHTPDGGRVSVAVTRHGDEIAITVEDTGPGIPPEHLPRIFDRFYKVDESRSGTALPSGSGLGLSIVRAIVTRHGGTVTAGNRPDGGARFEVRLPVAVQ